MSEMLKGNYSLEAREVVAPEPGEQRSLESIFESNAMEKLGGSMAFVKKSAAFLWKGETTK